MPIVSIDVFDVPAAATVVVRRALVKQMKQLFSATEIPFLKPFCAKLGVCV